MIVHCLKGSLGDSMQTRRPRMFKILRFLILEMSKYNFNLKFWRDSNPSAIFETLTVMID